MSIELEAWLVSEPLRPLPTRAHHHPKTARIRITLRSKEPSRVWNQTGFPSYLSQVLRGPKRLKGGQGRLCSSSKPMSIRYSDHVVHLARTSPTISKGCTFSFTRIHFVKAEAGMGLDRQAFKSQLLCCRKSAGWTGPSD